MNADSIICDERRLGGIRGAKKKAGGSSTNGRNSAGRRLGIKVWPNKFASTFIFISSEMFNFSTLQFVDALFTHIYIL